MSRSFVISASIAIGVAALLSWVDLFYVDSGSITVACCLMMIAALWITCIAMALYPRCVAKSFKRMIGFSGFLFVAWLSIAIFHLPLVLLSVAIDMQCDSRGHLQPSRWTALMVKEDDGLFITNSDAGGRSGLYRLDRDWRPFSTFFEAPIGTRWAGFKED